MPRIRIRHLSCKILITIQAVRLQAKTDVKLWAIDGHTYRKILMSNTIRKRKLYETFLKNVTILGEEAPETSHIDATRSCPAVRRISHETI